MGDPVECEVRSVVFRGMSVSPMREFENRSNERIGETPVPRKRVRVVHLKHPLSDGVLAA